MTQKHFNSTGIPQFVRCIKPNDVRAPKCFESIKVVKQLRYTGVLETIRIRQHGFSHRILFADFLKRYCFLGFGFNERVVASRETCRLLLLRLKLDGWALGKSKVFLKYYHIEFLSKLYEEQIRKIVLVQAYVRRWLAKSRFKKMRKNLQLSALTLQKHVRGWITRRRFKLLREKQLREQQAEIERNEKDKKNVKQIFGRAALLQKLASEDKNENDTDKENRAAVVIQSCKIYEINLLKDIS